MWWIMAASILILALAICIYLYQKLHIAKIQAQMYIDENKRLNERTIELNEQTIELHKQTTALTSELGQLKLEQANDEHLMSLKAQIEVLNTQINELNNAISEKINQLNEITTTSTDLMASIDTNKENLEKILADVKEKIDERDRLVKVVDELKDVHSKAILAANVNNDNNGGVFKLNDDEGYLVKVLDELKSKYGELALEFATIEGRKVWMPKIQQLAAQNGLDKMTGIYKLTVIDNEGCGQNYGISGNNGVDSSNKFDDICYIGQATNVKERGYTHVKKLIGAEKIGTEKLYNCGLRPDMLRGEIIDEVDKKLLDERERYGIDFYAALEVGLNSKKGNLN